MAHKVRIAGQDWNVESIKQDGGKVIAVLVGGQEIVTRGVKAQALLTAFKMFASLKLNKDAPEKKGR